MTTLHGDKRITMRLSAKEWFAFLVAVVSVAGTGAAFYQKASETASELKQYKHAVDQKLADIAEDVAFIRGRMEK